MKPSGIGGQAVIEGIMMRNKDQYSIAVRKPDNEIEVTVRDCNQLQKKHPWLNYPMIRGVYSFVDSLVTGISTINYSASFYDDPAEQKSTKADEIGRAVFKDKLEAVLMAFTVILSVVFAVGLFMLIPYFVSRLLTPYVSSQFLLNFIEGLVRVVLFILYILAISQMKDIKRKCKKQLALSQALRNKLFVFGDVCQCNIFYIYQNRKYGGAARFKNPADSGHCGCFI